MPAIPSAVSALLGPIARAQPLVDGCISVTRRLTSTAGRSVVLKECAGAPPDLYRFEAEALQALAPSLRVPQVLGFGPRWLLLEDLGPQVSMNALPLPADDPAWDEYGRAFAHLHGRLASRCGWHHDTYWGLMRMDQRWSADPYEFYAEQRFAWFMRRPTTARWLTADDRRGLDAVAMNLRTLIPQQSACLNHGDLWAGNRMRAPEGGLAAIDPFIHYGWAECDLHNCLQFGGFPPRFFAAYEESHPLAPGWRERVQVFYLLHLLGMLDQNIEASEALPWLRRLIKRFGR
jgi:fructosamine-3-kinase